MSDNPITLSDVIQYLVDDFAKDIITGTYFDREDSAIATKDLAKLEEVVRGIVRNHDSLADSQNPSARIKGKKGRKPGTKVVPTTTDEIIRALTS